MEDTTVEIMTKDPLNHINTEINTKKPRGRPKKQKEPKPQLIKKTEDMTTYMKIYMQNYKTTPEIAKKLAEYQKEYRNILKQRNIVYQKKPYDPIKNKIYHDKYIQKKVEQQLREIQNTMNL
jgi:hypothetical protein